ncbi:amidohydrolase family-domain-containing protein [Salix suchowensis]|nr:amidohydrolase family-domain-containing protein [Salix suchowensis]
MGNVLSGEYWGAQIPRLINHGAHRRLTVRAIKLFTDGRSHFLSARTSLTPIVRRAGSWGAALLEPYSDNPSTSGSAQLQECTRQAGQSIIMGSADPANVTASWRPRIEHAQIMTLGFGAYWETWRQSLPVYNPRMRKCGDYASEGILADDFGQHERHELRGDTTVRASSDRRVSTDTVNRALKESKGLMPTRRSFIEGINPLLGFYAAYQAFRRRNISHGYHESDGGQDLSTKVQATVIDGQPNADVLLKPYNSGSTNDAKYRDYEHRRVMINHPRSHFCDDSLALRFGPPGVVYLNRRGERTLSAQNKARYIGAVKCLQALPAQTSFTGVRTRFDDFQALHVSIMPEIHLVVRLWSFAAQGLTSKLKNWRRANSFRFIVECFKYTRKRSARSVGIPERNRKYRLICIRWPVDLRLNRYWDWTKDVEAHPCENNSNNKVTPLEAKH